MGREGSVRDHGSYGEVDLELDTDKLTLKEFIRIVNERFTIHDMGIESLPIERVIKELYANQCSLE